MMSGKLRMASGFWVVLFSLPLLLAASDHADMAEQLHIFIRGDDNASYELFWDGNKWNGWTRREGDVSEAPAAVDYNGRLQVFARGMDHAFYQTHWDGRTWSAWYRYDVFSASAPAVVSHNGQLHVFAVGGDGALYWIHGDGRTWSDWVNLGGYVLDAPAAVSYDGRLVVFVTGQDHALYQLGWDGSDWSDWTRYDGYLAYGPGATSWNGQLHVFGVSGDHALYQMYWDGESWNGWDPLGGHFISSPCAVTYNGQLEVFVTGGDHAVHAKRFDGIRWSEWSSLGGATSSAPGVASFRPATGPEAEVFGDSTTVPGAPTGVKAVAGDAQAVVSFKAPAANGGSPISSYTVTSSPGSITAQGASSPISVPGLSNGTAYTFTVTATNQAGTGPPSTPSNKVTPATVPGAPTGAKATWGDAQAAVSFKAPASNGGSRITSFTVTSSPEGVNATGEKSPITVPGLSNGTAYTFTVTATNKAGTGPPSPPSNKVIPASLPGAPTGAKATWGNAQVVVGFKAPAANGGSRITSYTVTSSPGGIIATGEKSPITVPGLTNGTAYTFTVTATNKAGTGPPSPPSNKVIPATVPGAPTGVKATWGDAQAKVSFKAPAASGGSRITSYTVTSSPDSISATGEKSPITVPGLSNGTAYTFTVAAKNKAGTGPASTPSNKVTPATIPEAPTGVMASEGNAEATVSFTPPASNGGNRIIFYTVTSSPDSITAQGASSPITVPGLTNGTAYTFTVTAKNKAGTSPPSAPSNEVTPATVPGSPTGAAATEGNAEATVSFKAPASNGGSPITFYTVTSSPGGITAQGASSPITVPGLTNGSTYTFTVTATNKAGTGLPSGPTNEVAPVGLPEAPTGTTATAGNAQATVGFTAPASDGGSPITSYTVTSSPGGVTAQGASSPITVPGLTNGTTYTFTVTAANKAGTGPPSTPSNPVTPNASASDCTPPTLGQVVASRTVTSFGKDDSLRAGGLVNLPPALAPLVAARVIAFTGNAPLIAAAAGLPSCTTLVVAEGAAGVNLAGIPLSADAFRYVWEVDGNFEGTYYSTDSSPTAAFPYGAKITDFNLYDRNSVFMEMPSIGFPIQAFDHTGRDALAKVHVEVNKSPPCTAQQCRSDPKSQSFAVAGTVGDHLTIGAVAVATVNILCPLPQIEVNFSPANVGNFEAPAGTVFRVYCDNGPNSGTGPAAISDFVAPIGFCCYPRDYADKQVSIAVVESSVGFVQEPPAQSYGIDTFRCTGCSIGDTASFLIKPAAHTISGTVTDATGEGLAGVTVTLGGDGSDTTTTDGSGNYSFSKVFNGNYTITPAKGGYTFNPANLNPVVNGADVPNVNFVANPVTYSISGYTRTKSGDSLAGVTIGLTGPSGAGTVTNAGGFYNIPGLSSGKYTITPNLPGYIFDPASLEIDLTSNYSVDFSATPLLYSVSGKVQLSGGTGLSDVTITLSGGAEETTLTASDGTYSFSNLANNTYTLKASKDGYDITPENQSFTIIGANVTGMDFTATPKTYSISGKVSDESSNAMSGVAVNLTGSSSASTTTAADGSYSFTGVPTGTYTVTPAKDEYDLGSKNVTLPQGGGSATGVDFIGKVKTYSISGNVTDEKSGSPLSGVTVSLTGGSSASTTTAGGAYSFSNLVKGDYTVSVSKDDYDFPTKSQAVHVDQNTGSVSDVNFTGKVKTYSISGTVTEQGGPGMSGVAVSLSGSSSASTTTIAGGSYSFDELEKGTYTITPSKDEWDFTPASKTVTVDQNSGNASGVDFQGIEKTYDLYVENATEGCQFGGATNIDVWVDGSFHGTIIPGSSLWLQVKKGTYFVSVVFASGEASSVSITVPDANTVSVV